MQIAVYSVKKITFKIFAGYRVALGFDQVQLELPAEVQSIEHFLKWLVDQHPDWMSVLNAPDRLVALNQTLVEQDAVIHAGDEIAFLPPVTGG